MPKKKKPKHSRSAQKYMSKHISEDVRKGKSQKQAIAIAYSKARKKGYKVPKKKS